MATITSTGQITIIDQNDAKPITTYLGASQTPQQLWNHDETDAWTPSWTTVGVKFTPYVYVGSGTNETLKTTMTGHMFSFDGTTDLSNGANAATALASYFDTGGSPAITIVSTSTEVSCTIKANLKPTTTPLTLYYTASYIDPVTTGTITIKMSTIVSVNTKGTNAVFMDIVGQQKILKSMTTTQGQTQVAARLIRASLVDDTNVQYRWYTSPFNAGAQIDYNHASIANFGMIDTAAWNAGRTGTIGQFITGAASATAAIAVGNLPDGGWVDAKGIVIGEKAVNNFAVFMVEARSTLDNVVYSTYVTINDLSDPIKVEVFSSTGDKLQNGTGISTLTPRVFDGTSWLTSLTGWEFYWFIQNKIGKPAWFIDTAIADEPGRNITANTTGTTASFTVDTAVGVQPGDIIKCVKPDGSAFFYETSSTGTVASIVIRPVAANGGLAGNGSTTVDFPALTATDYPVPTVVNEFGTASVPGKLFVCKTTNTRGQMTYVKTLGATPSIVISGGDIDGKGTISCIALKPI